jgi:hypothetical protein
LQRINQLSFNDRWLIRMISQGTLSMPSWCGAPQRSHQFGLKER